MRYPQFQLLVWLCLFERAISAPVGDQAQVFIDTGEQSIVQIVESLVGEPKLHYNLTFDNINLHGHPRAPLDYAFPLQFTNFDIVNVTSAIHHELISPTDLTCSLPQGNNALFTPQMQHFSPSRFDLDPEVSRQFNVSEYADFVGFTVKHAGAVDERGLAQIKAYRMHRGTPLHVFTGGVIWPAQGIEHPIRGDLGTFFPGWGKEVNMFEVEGRSMSGRHVPICIGRIEVFLKS